MKFNGNKITKTKLAKLAIDDLVWRMEGLFDEVADGYFLSSDFEATHGEKDALAEEIRKIAARISKNLGVAKIRAGRAG